MVAVDVEEWLLLSSSGERGFLGVSIVSDCAIN
jgi:hypothetical protein